MTARQLDDLARYDITLSRAESRRRAKILGLLKAGLPIASGGSGPTFTEILGGASGIGGSSATSTTFTFQTSAGTGALGYIVVSHDTTGTLPSSFTDSAGNTWTKSAASSGWTTGTVAIYYCLSLADAIVGGTTTFTVTTAGSSNKTAKAVAVTGVTSVSVDKSNTHTNTSATSVTTGTTGTLTQSNEIAVAAYGYMYTSSPSFTPATGWSQTATTQQVCHGSAIATSSMYDVVSATSALNPSATLGTAENCGGAILTFEYTASGSAPVNTVAPAVTGTTTVGQTLSCTTGTWTDDGSPTFSYQWQRDVLGNGVYSNIGSATSSTYVLADADDGCHVRCNVTDSTPDGNTTQASNAVGTIVEPAPTNSVAPTISGSAAQGSTLTCNSNGAWAHMAGNGPTYTYQWTRAGVNIASATASTYQTVNADVGSAIGVKVTAHNDGGTATQASSNTVTPTTAGFHTGTMTMQFPAVADIVAEWNASASAGRMLLLGVG